MKRVFSSNAQVAHVWANQNQPEGRTENLFFRDSVIFSYGAHYPLAKVHKQTHGKGKTWRQSKIALINSQQSTKTTEGKHKNAVRNALRGLMPYFASPDIYSIKEAIKYNDAQAQLALTSGLKKNKVTSSEDIKFFFEQVLSAFQQATNLRTHAGKAEIWAKKRDLDKVEKHLKARLARYNELQTPAMLQKREQARLKRETAKAQTIAKLRLERIEKFRQGEGVHISGLAHELLRLSKDGATLETSRGARVPAMLARDILQRHLGGEDISGWTIGGFVVNRLEESDNGTIICIGCHRIAVSEARQVLGV